MKVETPGTILRQLVTLAWPVIGLNFFTVLALAIDTAMVGHLPEAEAALAGLSVASQLVFLLMVFMIGVTVGSVAFVARAHGAGDRARVEEIVAQSATLAVGLGLLVAVGGNLVAEPVLRLLGAQGPELDAGLRFLRPLLLFSSFNYLNILLISVLRGVGNTRLPFLVSASANLVNFLINYGLIMGHWGLPSLGVLGAALGTGISQIYAVLVLGGLLARGAVPALRIRPRLVRPRLQQLRDLLRIGTPAALDVLILNVSFLSIMGMLGRIDPLAVAAHGVGLRIQALAFMPGLGVSQAIGALVGQALGAGDPGRARAVLRVGVLFCVVLMSVLGGLIHVLAPFLVSLFDVDPAGPVGRYALTWMRMLGLSMPIMGAHIAFVGLFQGSGATRSSLFINGSVSLFLQIPASWILGFPMGLGAFGVWLGFPVSFLIKAAWSWWVYRRGAWARTGERV